MFNLTALSAIHRWVSIELAIARAVARASRSRLMPQHPDRSRYRNLLLSKLQELRLRLRPLLQSPRHHVQASPLLPPEQLPYGPLNLPRRTVLLSA